MAVPCSAHAGFTPRRMRREASADAPTDARHGGAMQQRCRFVGRGYPGQRGGRQKRGRILLNLGSCVAAPLAYFGCNLMYRVTSGCDLMCRVLKARFQSYIP